MTQTVLVTGVARDLPARCARSLAAHFDVVGVDLTPPRNDLGPVRFQRVDPRSPVLRGVIEKINPDIVIHSSWGAVRAKEPAVLVTMHLLAALERAAAFRHLVLLSSSRAYPATASAPARWREDATDNLVPETTTQREVLEVEKYALATTDDVAVLRLAPLMGAGVCSTVTDVLAGDAVVTSAGFNPRLQFLHPADAAWAVEAAVDKRVRGTFNVAADDVVLLGQALRILGRPRVPVAAALIKPLARLMNRFTSAHLADDAAEIAFGRVLDTAAFRAATGWTAKTSTRRAIKELAAQLPPGPLSLDRWDSYLASVLGGSRA